MSKRLRVRWTVNVGGGFESIALEGLDVCSVEEWEALSGSEQAERVQNAIDSIDGLVYPIVDTWELS